MGGSLRGAMGWQLFLCAAAAGAAFGGCASAGNDYGYPGQGPGGGNSGAPPPFGGTGAFSGSSSTGGFEGDSGTALIGPLLGGTTAGTVGASDGQLAISPDGSLIYVVSADDNQLLVIDPTGTACAGSDPTLACIEASVPVGQSPARVVVGADGTIYVSNRGSRSISVIAPTPLGAWSVTRTLSTGAEPIGLAVSANGTLYVANYASGTVQAFDVSLGTLSWQTPVGSFPRGVVSLATGKLYVSHYLSGQVDVLDATTGALLKSVSANVGVVPALTQSHSPDGTLHQTTFSAVGLDSLVASHDGTRAYLAHRRERSGLISEVSFPPIVAPAITTFETATDLPHDDALEDSQDYPPTLLYPENRLDVITAVADAGPFPGTTSGGGNGGGAGSGGGGYGGMAVAFGWSQAPVALVEDPQGQYLFVANRDSASVTILPAHRRSGADAPGGINASVQVGDGPTGLALSPDNSTLYVYSSISHSLSRIASAGLGSVVEQVRLLGVGTNGPLGAEATLGRALFFSASNPGMSAPGAGVACESCHLEGGTDGHVWQFVWGPRKTMGLLGKDILATGAYHWDGTEGTMPTLLSDTITVRMGGAGVDVDQATQISAYLGQLAPADNPNRLAAGLSTSQAHGQTLFATNCQACHAGSAMTDNGFHDVGTRVMSNPLGQPDDLCRLGGLPPSASCLTDNPLLPSVPNPANHGGFNTPTALGLYFAPPYFHDGSAATLEDVVPRMLSGAGLPGLSAGDTADLVAYLQTL